MSEAEAREIIGIAVGRASMCWENIEGAGIFDDGRAIEVIEDLLTQLELRELPEGD